MMPAERTQLTRLPKRGSHDTATIYPILDEGLVCHVSYNVNGQLFMIPIAYCRINDTVYIHRSVGSHFLRELAKGIDVCLAVTLIDGLVLARSAFHHSVNYRSVILFGKTQLVTNETEAWDVLACITEHLVPGRWDDTRQPNVSEMKKTMVLAIPIDEASSSTDGRAGLCDEMGEVMVMNDEQWLRALLLRARSHCSLYLLTPRCRLPIPAVIF